jgi:hypothetical protein
MNLKDEIMRRVDALPAAQQRQVLAYCDTFEQACVHGEAGHALLSFAGVLDDTSAHEMREAIEAGCEGIDSREW